MDTKYGCGLKTISQREPGDRGSRHAVPGRVEAVFLIDTAALKLCISYWGCHESCHFLIWAFFTRRLEIRRTSYREFLDLKKMSLNLLMSYFI